MRQIQIKLVGVTRKRPGIKPPYNVKELSLIPLKVLFFLCACPENRHELFSPNVHTYMYNCTYMQLLSLVPSLFPQFDCSTRISRCDVPSMIEARTLPSLHTQL